MPKQVESVQEQLIAQNAEIFTADDLAGKITDAFFEYEDSSTANPDTYTYRSVSDNGEDISLSIEPSFREDGSFRGVDIHIGEERFFIDSERSDKLEDAISAIQNNFPDGGYDAKDHPDITYPKKSEIMPENSVVVSQEETQESSTDENVASTDPVDEPDDHEEVMGVEMDMTEVPEDYEPISDDANIPEEAKQNIDEVGSESYIKAGQAGFEENPLQELDFSVSDTTLAQLFPTYTKTENLLTTDNIQNIYARNATVFGFTPSGTEAKADVVHVISLSGKDVKNFDFDGLFGNFQSNADKEKTINDLHVQDIQEIRYIINEKSDFLDNQHEITGFTGAVGEGLSYSGLVCVDLQIIYNNDDVLYWQGIVTTTGECVVDTTAVIDHNSKDEKITPIKISNTVQGRGATQDMVGVTIPLFDRTDFEHCDESYRFESKDADGNPSPIALSDEQKSVISANIQSDIIEVTGKEYEAVKDIVESIPEIEKQLTDEIEDDKNMITRLDIATAIETVDYIRKTDENLEKLDSLYEDVASGLQAIENGSPLTDDQQSALSEYQTITQNIADQTDKQIDARSTIQGFVLDQSVRGNALLDIQGRSVSTVLPKLSADDKEAKNNMLAVAKVRENMPIFIPEARNLLNELDVKTERNTLINNAILKYNTDVKEPQDRIYTHMVGGREVLTTYSGMEIDPPIRFQGRLLASPNQRQGTGAFGRQYHIELDQTQKTFENKTAGPSTQIPNSNETREQNLYKVVAGFLGMDPSQNDSFDKLRLSLNPIASNVSSGMEKTMAISNIIMDRYQLSEKLTPEQKDLLNAFTHVSIHEPKNFDIKEGFRVEDVKKTYKSYFEKKENKKVDELPTEGTVVVEEPEGEVVAPPVDNTKTQGQDEQKETSAKEKDPVIPRMRGINFKAESINLAKWKIDEFEKAATKELSGRAFSSEADKERAIKQLTNERVEFYKEHAVMPYVKSLRDTAVKNVESGDADKAIDRRRDMMAQVSNLSETMAKYHLTRMGCAVGKDEFLQVPVGKVECFNAFVRVFTSNIFDTIILNVISKIDANWNVTHDTDKGKVDSGVDKGPDGPDGPKGPDGGNRVDNEDAKNKVSSEPVKGEDMLPFKDNVDKEKQGEEAKPDNSDKLTEEDTKNRKDDAMASAGESVDSTSTTEDSSEDVDKGTEAKVEEAETIEKTAEDQETNKNEDESVDKIENEQESDEDAVNQGADQDEEQLEGQPLEAEENDNPDNQQEQESSIDKEGSEQESSASGATEDTEEHVDNELQEEISSPDATEESEQIATESAEEVIDDVEPEIDQTISDDSAETTQHDLEQDGLSDEPGEEVSSQGVDVEETSQNAPSGEDTVGIDTERREKDDDAATAMMEETSSSVDNAANAIDDAERSVLQDTAETEKEIRDASTEGAKSEVESMNADAAAMHEEIDNISDYEVDDVDSVDAVLEYKSISGDEPISQEDLTTSISNALASNDSMEDVLAEKAIPGLLGGSLDGDEVFKETADLIKDGDYLNNQDALSMLGEVGDVVRSDDQSLAEYIINNVPEGFTDMPEAEMIDLICQGVDEVAISDQNGFVDNIVFDGSDSFDLYDNDTNQMDSLNSDLEAISTEVQDAIDDLSHQYESATEYANIDNVDVSQDIRDAAFKETLSDAANGIDIDSQDYSDDMTQMMQDLESFAEDPNKDTFGKIEQYLDKLGQFVDDPLGALADGISDKLDAWSGVINDPNLHDLEAAKAGESALEAAAAAL